MSINSKQKGNSFELKVAKILTDWSGEEFHRTPMSGALHWSNDKRVVSDIVPPNNMEFPFSIECKNQENPWDFDSIIKKTSVLWKHWEQAESDAMSEGLVPMLIFTRNYRDDYIAIPENIYGILYGDSHHNLIRVGVKGKTPLVIFKFQDFINTTSVDNVKNLYKKIMPLDKNPS